MASAVIYATGDIYADDVTNADGVIYARAVRKPAQNKACAKS